MSDPFSYFGGMQIVTDIHMTVPYEDWSRVRSPSRAARRRKRGFPQNIVVRRKPDTKIVRFGNRFIMHPEMLKEFRRKLETEFRP